MAKKILLVAPPYRKDFYSFLEHDTSNEYEQLWFDSPAEMHQHPASAPSFVRRTLYWGDYRTPKQLLESVRPDKVVVMEMVDLHQIALIATARKMRIPTIYLDHGAAGDRETYMRRMRSEPTFFFRKLVQKLRRPAALWSFLKTRAFYLSATHACSSGSKLAYVLLSFRLISRPVMQALHATRFPERNPEHFIVFSSANADQYRLCYDLDGNAVHHTGVPTFDTFFRAGTPTLAGHLVFIDHPYFESGLYGWTGEHHHRLARTLESIARTHEMPVYVKLHPASDLSRWRAYKLDTSWVRVLQAGDFTELYLSSALILGFASSMLTGFLCARKNVVLVGWHPEPEVIGSNFSAYDICHVSTDMERAVLDIPLWLSHNRCEENYAGYQAFVSRYNAPFDGCAVDRILGVIGG
jgi:hypothetical protein